MLSLPGSLRISSCPALLNLTLPSLHSIGDFILIAANEQLSQLQFQVLGFVGGDFYILDNPALPTAQAEGLRDAVDVANIGGQVVISGNAP